MNALRRATEPIQAIRIDNAAHMIHPDTPHRVAHLIRAFVLGMT
jgi:hypothetical protein